MFLPAGDLGCVGALTGSLYSGGVVAESSITVRITEIGVYKVCRATTATPLSDAAFVQCAGILLPVTLASPPPPPPPPVDVPKSSKDPIDIAAAVTGTVASVIAIAGAVCAARRKYFRKRRRGGLKEISIPDPVDTEVAMTELNSAALQAQQQQSRPDPAPPKDEGTERGTPPPPVPQPPPPDLLMG